MGGGVHEAEESAAVPTRVPAADHRIDPQGGRTPESLAEQFEPSAQTIRNWLAQAERDAGQRTDGLTTDEREELRRLRRENKALTCFLAAAHGRHIQALGFCLRRSSNACSAG
jgi:transposase